MSNDKLQSRHKIGDTVTITAKVAGIQFSDSKVRYVFDLGETLSIVDSDYVSTPSIDGRYINQRGPESGASVVISLASAAALAKAIEDISERQPYDWTALNLDLAKGGQECSRAVAAFIEACDFKPTLAAGED